MLIRLMLVSSMLITQKCERCGGMNARFGTPARLSGSTPPVERHPLPHPLEPAWEQVLWAAHRVSD